MTTAFVDFNGVVPEKARYSQSTFDRNNTDILHRFSLMLSSFRIWLMQSTAIRAWTSKWYLEKDLAG